MCIAKTSNSPSTDSTASDTDSNTSAVTHAPSGDITTHSLKAESSDFLEFEGTATFAPIPAPIYRYTLSLQNSKLRIWFEDCRSKKQWLNLNDYVDLTNAIPSATAADYVEYFRELIEGAHDNNTNASVVVQCPSGDLQLQVKINVDVLQKSRVATYTFKLETISLERIDVLESKMRDLEEEVNTLRSNDEKAAATHSAEIQELRETVQSLSLAIKTLEEVVAAQAQTIQKLDEVDTFQTSKLKQQDEDIAALCLSLQTIDGNVGQHSAELPRMNGEVGQVKNEVEALRLACTRVDSCCFRASSKVGDWILWENFPNGVVSAPASGTFYVVAVVNYQTNLSNQFIQLIRGNTLLKWESCDNRYLGGHSNTASLSCIAYVEKNDQLAVHCPVSVIGTSYLAIIRVGN